MSDARFEIVSSQTCPFAQRTRMVLLEKNADFDLTEIEDQLVAFATCMRGQGIDMDDPDLTDFAPGGAGGADGGPFGDIDIDDPEVQAALEVCQAEIAFGQGAPPAGG